MVSKGYTTSDNVATQLGRTLTAPQLTYVDGLLIPAAEQWIDIQGGRTYGNTPVVAEPLYMYGNVTWLTKTPVSTLSEVRGYLWGQTIVNMMALPTTYYLLQDPRIGQLYIPYWHSYMHLEADYVPSDVIPSNITLATTMLCCVWMRTVLHPQTDWLTEYGSGQDVRLKFKDTIVPQEIYDLLGTGNAGIVVA